MKVSIKPKHWFIVALLVLLAVYSLYQARFLIFGPQVWITSPTNGQTIEDSLVIIEGRAKNVAWISLNDHQIFTDENGKWSEELIVSDGISIMTIKARDRFGRETEESVQVVLPVAPAQVGQTSL